MITRLRRRQFLRAFVGAAALPLLGRCARRTAGAAAATSAGAGLTTYQLGPQIWVRWNNRVVTCYRAHRSQKYPYLYPVTAPSSGLSLTTETGLPWPHHRSLFFGCDRVNGGNYWQEGFGTGQILSQGPRLGQTTRDSVEILDACDWQKPGGAPVMRDERKITVRILNSRLRLIDFEIQWSAVQDVSIPKTNHSLFAARAALDLTPLGGGQLLNAEGLSGEKATFGRPSAWCDFYGKAEGGRQKAEVEGLALLDHPRNPWPHCPWFTRDYGFMSPTPMNFLDKPWELAAGQSVNLRYRVVLHTGDPQEAGLTEIAREWANT